MSRKNKKIGFLFVLFLLKVMGVKKNFSQDPIDYIKVRKGDIRWVPKAISRKFDVQEITIGESRITEVSPKNSAPSTTVLFIHGGAFISGPSKLQWDGIKHLVTNSQARVVMVDYPKAPENDILSMNRNIDAVYEKMTQKFSTNKIVLIGDSVGGNLIMSLVQRLIHRDARIPDELVLITPVFDSSMSNPKILEIDPEDPMLARKGILSAKKMCANGMDLKDPAISPLYGRFDGFPSTLLFIGGRDIMSPDALLGAAKMRSAGVKLDMQYDATMPHVYPLLPIIREAAAALQRIETVIALEPI